MINLTKKSADFIRQHILGKMGYIEISEENIAEVVDYIIENIEVPLAQAQEAGEAIDEELLELATQVVTEITSDENW